MLVVGASGRGSAARRDIALKEGSDLGKTDGGDGRD